MDESAGAGRLDDVANLRQAVGIVEAQSVRAAEAESDFGPFFEQSSDLLCTASGDGTLECSNPAWASCLGWTPEELRGRSLLDFVHPDDRDATQAEAARLVRGGAEIFFENRLRHRDGSYRQLQWSARPLPGCRKFYATGRDVTRVLRLEREVVESVDQERLRLAREMHDGLCQSLAGIAALSTTLARRLARGCDSDRAAAEEISGLLYETIRQARDLTRDLAPVHVTDSGLDQALGAMARSVEHMFGVSCRFDCVGALPEIGAAMENHLFRIAREAVSNAVSHGRPDRIEISLECLEARGHLIVKDDGSGIGGSGSRPAGLGLQTMAYRAGLIGGTLEMGQRLGRGTAVTCSFPFAGRR